MVTSDFDFWAEGQAAAKHLQTLFWMGGDIFHFVLRWRGKAFPEVGERFKASFQQLQLREQWLVEIGEKETQGIRIGLLRCYEIEQLTAFEDRVKQNQMLRADEQITANTLADFQQITQWLKRFDDKPA